MSYKIAIPSHKRPELCKKQVLDLKSKLPFNTQFYVFIANYDKEYEFDIENCTLIVHGQIGIQKTRNFIYKFFENGEKIVCIDDSFTGILQKKEGKLVEFNNYDSLIKIGFDELLKNKTILFGINLTENPFFMTKKIQKGNFAICAKFHGVIIDHQTLISINPFGLAEDQEISLRTTRKYGCVIRFGTFTFNKPKYGKIKGGVQAYFTNEERAIIEAKSYLYLSSNFKDFCTFKKGGIGLKYKIIKK